MNRKTWRKRLNEGVNNLVSKASPEIANILTAPIRPKQAALGTYLTLLTAAGCGEIPNQDLSKFITFGTPKPEVYIGTTQLPKGKVNQEYSAVLETEPADAECQLIDDNDQPLEAVNGIALKDHAFQGKPYSSSNEQRGFTQFVIMCTAPNYMPKTEIIPIEIEAGEDPSTPGILWDYWQEISIKDGGTVDIISRCEKGLCQEPYNLNNGTMEQRQKEFKEESKRLMEIVQEYFLPSRGPPIITEYSRFGSTTCPAPPSFDWTASSYGSLNCIYIPSAKPEVHEEFHSITYDELDGGMGERSAEPTAQVARGNVSSFCELDGSEWHNTLMTNLCRDFGIDYVDIAKMLRFARQKYFETGVPATAGFLKCVADEIANDIDNETHPENPPDYDQNTYNNFVTDACQGANRSYCNLTNPKSLFYVDPNPCVPKLITRPAIMPLHTQN